MNRVEILFNESKEAIVLYYQTLDHKNFLGYETKDGQRYMCVNWYTSNGFEYPMVGGNDVSVYAQNVRGNKNKMQEMAQDGTFYIFNDANEMYRWMGERHRRID